MAWTDYYVDLAATGGSPDGSTSAPWQSYAAAKSGIEAAFGGTTATAPTRIFVRGNGSLSGALALSTAGTAAFPIYWVGCTGNGTTWTRIGNASSDSRPLLTCGTNQVTITGGFQVFEGLAFTSAQTASSNGCVVPSGAQVHMVRCRFTGTAANANCIPLRKSGSGGSVVACSTVATTTATYSMTITADTIAFGNLINGGINGLFVNAAVGRAVAQFNIVYGHTTDGIKCAEGGYVTCNTVYGGTGDGIESAAIGGFFACNLIVGDGNMDYPFNFTNATANIPPFMFNAWYNVASDSINGVTESGDDVAHCFGNSGLLGGNPLPNVGTIDNANDFDLAATYKALAFPGAFEAGGGYAYTGYLDHGAVQRQEAAGGGGGGAKIIGG